MLKLEKNRILYLRKLLLTANKVYYSKDPNNFESLDDLGYPDGLSDFEFDRLLRELAWLESKHPEFHDPKSPTLIVGH